MRNLQVLPNAGGRVYGADGVDQHTLPGEPQMREVGGEGMISLEKARKLKEAGLVWKARIGDWYYEDAGEDSGHFLIDCYEGTYQIPKHDNMIWLPSLSQLLGELRKHSMFVKITWLVMDEKWDCVIDGREQFLADTPEDAAAEALIWILGQEASQ